MACDGWDRERGVRDRGRRGERRVGVGARRRRPVEQTVLGECVEGVLVLLAFLCDASLILEPVGNALIAPIWGSRQWKAQNTWERSIGLTSQFEVRELLALPWSGEDSHRTTSGAPQSVRLLAVNVLCGQQRTHSTLSQTDAGAGDCLRRMRIVAEHAARPSSGAGPRTEQGAHPQSRSRLRAMAAQIPTQSAQISAGARRERWW